MTPTSSRPPLRDLALQLSRLPQLDILKQLGIKHYDKDILTMSKPELGVRGVMERKTGVRSL